jgi:hypothetical protein
MFNQANDGTLYPVLVKTPHGTTRLHWLKSWPEHFAAAVNGSKKAEMRLNDRRFLVGDILGLEEWDPNEKDNTGRQFFVRVTHIGEKYAGVVDSDYVLLSFEPTSPPQ